MMPWSSSGMNPAGIARPARADGHHEDDQDRQHRTPDEQPGHPDVAGGRPVEHPVEPRKNMPSGPPGPWVGLSSITERAGRQRQRAEGREQDRDGDRQANCWYMRPVRPAQEGDRDEHGRQDEGDADDGAGHILHGLDRRVPWAQAVLHV